MSEIEQKTVIDSVPDAVPKNCLATKCKAMNEYFKETNLRINLERQNREIKEQNIMYQEAISSLLNMIKGMFTPNFPANNLFREYLQNIMNVNSAYSFINNEVINYWVIIKEENFKTELEIANAFRQVVLIFRNFLFDLMIIPKQGLSLEDIVPANSQLIFSNI